MAEIKLKTPLTDKDVEKLQIGDKVLLTGVIYTGRDAAHKRLFDLIQAGKELPIDICGQVIYYVGPAPAKPGKPIGSAGPTTSYRMDAFAPKLMATKRRARLDYGRMVGEQGRLVRRRWILGETAAQGEMLEPEGVGPVADAQALHDAVMRMRMAPIGKSALFAALIPIVLPMLAVFAIQIPLKTMLFKILKMLA